MSELQKLISVVSTKDIKVHPELPRIRQEDGDIQELADSIATVGQLTPIIITEKFELVAGWRRLQACKKLGIDIKCINVKDATPKVLRLIEIEENTKRKSFTPAEELLATREYHLQMQKEKGNTTSGVKGGHTLNDTASALGVSKATVIRNIELAGVIDVLPDLKFAKKKSDISQAQKRINLVNHALDGLDKFKKAQTDTTATYKIFNMSCIEYLDSIKDTTIDIVLSDPYYGFKHDTLSYAKTAEAGYRLNDTEGISDIIKMLQHLKPKVKPTSHIYLFVGPEFFHAVRYEMIEAGWEVHQKPIIWIKRASGQCNVPDKWPSSCYEMLLYGRMPEAKLTKPGMPDWIQCDPVSNKIHPYQKPIPLLKNLLLRVVMPGNLVFDPFMGSGATLKAATELKMYAVGTEIDKGVFAIANDYLG